ncbi:MAG: hypothetical protein IPH50_14265 [Rhodanobacteraceae bacterium]|nr:hypothetical protein [Rhodanobacteraceae bacterium]
MDWARQPLPCTSGAMLDAARLALSLNTAVAAPVSGFDHARWNTTAERDRRDSSQYLPGVQGRL